MWVFLLLGGFVAYDYFWMKPKREESAIQETHVAWIKDERLEQIKLANVKAPVSLTCIYPEGCPPDATADWKLEAPMVDAGDSTSIGSLASTILNLTYLEKLDFDSVPDPKEFGLGEGAKRLEIKLKDEPEPLVLEVGSGTASGPNVYVWSSRTPNRLYVVASYFAQMLDKDLFHWRNKRLFPKLETENVTALEWKGKSSLKAVKKDGEWKIESPIAADANHIMMEGLVSTLVYSSAISIFSDSSSNPETKKAMAGRPAMEFTFTDLKGERALKLFSRGKTPEFFAVAGEGGPVYLVDGAPFDRFSKPLLEYRDRRIFAKRDAGSVDEMELKFPREGKQVTLTLKDGAWTPKENQPEPLSQSRIKSIVSALFNVEATVFLPSSSQAATLLRTQPVDVEVRLNGAALPEAKARFLVMERKSAITEGRTPAEVRIYGEDLLKALPIRLQDLYETNNKTVIPETKKENDGHNHEHHSGHGHAH